MKSIPADLAEVQKQLAETITEDMWLLECHCIDLDPTHDKFDPDNCKTCPRRIEFDKEHP